MEAVGRCWTAWILSPVFLTSSSPPRDLFKKSFILIKVRGFKRSMCVNSHRGDTSRVCWVGAEGIRRRNQGCVGWSIQPIWA